MQRLGRLLIFILFFLGLKESYGEWGKNVVLIPEWQKIKKAAFKAIIAPETWIPAAGALLVQIDDLDDRISDWAADNNPVFGSEDRAKSISDYLGGASAAAYALTGLLCPYDGDVSDFLKNKGKGFLIGSIALLIGWQLAEGLKDISDRTRPDYEDDESFPSGHTLIVSLLSTLATQNLEYMDISDRSKKLLHIGFSSLAFTTAWARIEARKHYPSDVLMGYAIGHFLGIFFNELFFYKTKSSYTHFSVTPLPGGVMFGFHIRY